MQVIPDDDALSWTAQEYPTGKSDAELWRLAQARTLMQLAKAENMTEVDRMSRAGLLDDLIALNNEKVLKSRE